MTTLTAGTQPIAEHCEHKLPTSCRLTARPICCACQDTRPHASSYSVYIDGVGFVLCAQRQDKYCWPCKIFWDRRIEDSGLVPEETRIPTVPDQTDFIVAWFNWHQGHRIITRPDGNLVLQAVVGEPLGEVEPGCLPRSVSDLRAGLAISSEQTAMSDAQRQRSAASRRGHAGEHQEMRLDLANVPEEDRLFDLEPETAAEYTTSADTPTDVGSGVNRTVTEFVVNASPNAEASTAHHQNNSENTPQNSLSLTNHNLRLLEASTVELEEAFEDLAPPSTTGIRPIRRNEVNELSFEAVEEGIANLEGNLERFRRQQRRLAPLGSRREVEDPGYVSPIRNMFNNFQAQHLERQAERQRQDSEAPPQRPNNGTVSTMPTTLEDEYDEIDGPVRHRRPRVQSVQRNGPRPSPHAPFIPPRGSPNRNTIGAVEPSGGEHAETHQSLGLDDPRRPASLDEDQQWVKMSCVICFSQIARIVVVPCGHLVMCKPCADRAVPSKPQDKTEAQRGSKCPVCRTVVKRKYTVYGPEATTERRQMRSTGSTRVGETSAGRVPIGSTSRRRGRSASPSPESPSTTRGGVPAHSPSRQPWSREYGESAGPGQGPGFSSSAPSTYEWESSTFEGSTPNSTQHSGPGPA